jgi:disulfide bond formation protein DsbB
MNRDAVLLFLSLLAVVAQLTVVAVLVIALGGRATARARRHVVATVGPVASELALAVAGATMAGSLYLSEVAHFTPCELCWYQRIALYPLVVLFGVAALRRDDVAPYALVLTGAGATISTYHMLVERIPSLGSSTCDPSNPCSLIWTERFGYLTIPTMALSASALLAVIVLTGRAWRVSAAETD